MCLLCTVKSLTKEFQIFEQKWGESQINGSWGDSVTYSFATKNTPNQFGSFDSFIIDEIVKTEIEEALASWETVADIRFKLSAQADAADIRFGWKDIDGAGNVLGQTTIPASGPLSNVVVALDINENWFFGGDAPEDKTDFSSTVTHEIGHAIGIDHSNSDQALMNAVYSPEVLSIQQDDINAATAIYGANDIVRVDVHRFYNPNLGGHFFTADSIEKDSVDENTSLDGEGVGFEAIPRENETINESVPVYRFFNSKLGSHFFTAFELEKDSVMTLQGFLFEGVGFRAFSSDSLTTVPIYRFFNTDSGGHFFTASKVERDAIMNIEQLRFEGEAFYAFADDGF